MAKKKLEVEPTLPEEIRAPLRTPKHIQLPCVTFKQGTHTLILFVTSAKMLWTLMKINKREEDKDEGYQRALSPARADKIANFIDADNVLPGSVLISLDDDAKLNRERNAIIIPNRADAGWVIDGQHRLAGASRAEKDVRRPLLSTSLKSQQRRVCGHSCNACSGFVGHHAASSGEWVDKKSKKPE